ncbi:MAG: 50S ribosomal protein L6 [Vampirovibrionia bacterium]
MSRIGKKPINIPDKVEVKCEGNVFTAKGPLATLSVELRPEVTVKIEDKQVLVEIADEKSRKAGAYHGLYRTLVDNAVVGVSKGFEKHLEIIGVGYRAQIDGRNLVMQLGYSHPIVIEPPEGIEIKVEANTKLTVFGADKQAVGDVSAEIRSKRPPEVYKGKGVRYKGEYIRRKAGKTGKK